MPRLHQDTCCRIQVVSTCCHQHVSCIGYRIVASLSSVCCWIKMDTSHKSPWHLMNSNVAEIQSTGIPDEQLVSVDIALPICIRIQVARPGYMYRHVFWCKGGIRPTGWRKKRGHPISLQIFWKFHDRIAWKLVNFCNILCWTQSLTFCLKISSRCDAT